MTAPRIDWPALAEPVARALLGEPTSRTRAELRYGRRGSLSVRLDTGAWFDHEAGEGGGVVALVERERRCSTREALEWLESARSVAPSAKRGPESPHTAFSRGEAAVGRYTPGGAKSALSGASAPVSDSEPAPDPATEPDPRERLVRRLWDASGPPDRTPGRAYLAGRWAWPLADVGGAPDLPPDVRWLAAGSCRQPDPAAKWRGLPAGAAGALVFAWRPMRPPEPASGALHSTAHFDPVPRALSLLAVSAGGERVTWFGRAVRVRTVGSRTRTVFTARPPSSAAPDEPVHAAEGEIDAIALTLAPWVGPGGVYAAGGTSARRSCSAPAR